MIGYVMNDPAANFDWFGYTGPALNMSFDQIDRGTYTSLSKDDVLSIYEPPALEVYTQIPINVYLILFIGIHIIQILVIFLVDRIWLQSTHSSITFWEKIIHSIQKSHFPFPYEDWDENYGECRDYIQRKEKALKEFVITALINLFFNMTLLFPLVVLCK